MRQLKNMAESNRRAEVDADVSKKLKESEAEKAALLKILEDKAAAEMSAETQRLIQLQVQKSELANLRAMETLAKLKEPARCVPRYFSDLTLDVWRNLDNLVDTNRALVTSYSTLPKI